MDREQNIFFGGGSASNFKWENIISNIVTIKVEILPVSWNAQDSGFTSELQESEKIPALFSMIFSNIALKVENLMYLAYAHWMTFRLNSTLFSSSGLPRVQEHTVNCFITLLNKVR